MATNWQLLSVALGGMLGSVLRYMVSIVFLSKQAVGKVFPWPTFAVNIIGSLAIGLIIGYSIKQVNFNANWRLFLATGICGGFTTFSTFSYEGFALLKNNAYTLFFLYVLLSITLGIAATALGYYLTK
jgi:fluoride exporter